MSKTVKIILKESALFSLLLSVYWVLSSILLIHFTDGLDQHPKIEFYIYWGEFESAIQIGVLTWFLVRISKRLENLNYWKLVIGSVVFFVISYHFNYLFDTVYFYATHPDYQAKKEGGIEGLLSFFTGRNETPPAYEPIRYFFGFIKQLYQQLQFFDSRILGGFLMILVLNPISLAFWPAWMVWRFLRNNRKQSQSTSQDE